MGTASWLPKRCISFQSQHRSLKLVVQTLKMAPTEQRERDIKELGIVCWFAFLYLSTHCETQKNKTCWHVCLHHNVNIKEFSYEKWKEDLSRQTSWFFLITVLICNVLCYSFTSWKYNCQYKSMKEHLLRVSRTWWYSGICSQNHSSMRFYDIQHPQYHMQANAILTVKLQHGLFRRISQYSLFI